MQENKDRNKKYTKLQEAYKLLEKSIKESFNVPGKSFQQLLIVFNNFIILKTETNPMKIWEKPLKTIRLKLENIIKLS